MALTRGSSELDEADRAMVAYALALTRTPHTIRKEDVERLCSVGFDDAAVLDICQVTAYYNYVNRLADGVGVELEDFWTEEDLLITREEFEALAEAEGPA